MNSHMTATAFTPIATVFVPVHDQDEAITFNRDVRGFEQRGHFTYGIHRQVEVAPTGSTVALPLVPPNEDRVTDRTLTRCAILSTNIDADRPSVGTGPDQRVRDCHPSSPPGTRHGKDQP